MEGQQGVWPVGGQPPGTAGSGSLRAEVRAGLWGCWSEGRLDGDGAVRRGWLLGVGIELVQFPPLVTADVWFYAPPKPECGVFRLRT